MFMKNKESMLDVMLSNIHPMVVQQMKGIKEYKEVEKKKDLIGTLRILKDICFADWNGGLSFQPMTCLGQCDNSLNFKQFQLSDAAYKEKVCTFYEALKSQTGKLPFSTKSLVYTIRERPDSEVTKPSGVTNWRDLTDDEA